MISFKRRISLSVILTTLAAILPLTTSAADKPTSVKVAAIQCSSDLGAVEKNRTKLSSLIDEAAAKGAKIVVLPETAITGYLSHSLYGSDIIYADLKTAKANAKDRDLKQAP